MSLINLHLRQGTPEDSLSIAALAVQVFLDTYATEGVRADLAAEAFAEYSDEAFARRLRQPGRHFILAEQSTGLVGFAEVQVALLPAPIGAVIGAELVRLYIQPQFQRRGIGQHLLKQAERLASAGSIGCLWLTAWEGNHRAIAFYAAQGYRDAGATSYSFQGNSYANRMFVKQAPTGSEA